MSKPYGKELILDLHECNPVTFSRNAIERYFIELCRAIKMERCDLHFWDDVGVPKKLRQTEPHLKGTSAIQFILTSNITIHTLDDLGQVYVNIFSCKDFDGNKATFITSEWFQGDVVNRIEVTRT